MQAPSMLQQEFERRWSEAEAVYEQPGIKEMAERFGLTKEEYCANFVRNQAPLVWTSTTGMKLHD